MKYTLSYTKKTSPNSTKTVLFSTLRALIRATIQIKTNNPELKSTHVARI